MNRFLRSRWAVPEAIPLVIPVFFACSFGVYRGYKWLANDADVTVTGSTPRFSREDYQHKRVLGIHTSASKYDPDMKN